MSQTQPFSMPMQWNAAGGDTLGDSTPIPEGWYLGAITSMEYTAKKNDPQKGFIAFTVTVSGGEHSGFQLFDNLMLWDDQNEKIVEITKKKVNTLCQATERIQLTDLNQLMNVPIYIKVAMQEGREVTDPNSGEAKNYPARNQIKTYKSVAAHQASNAPAAGIPATFGQGASPAAAPPASTFAQPAATVTTLHQPVQQQAAAPAQAAPAAQPAAASGAMPPWVKK